MMATVSRTATALTTPPATSHDNNKYSWDSVSVPVHSEKPVNPKRSSINNENGYPFGRPVLASQKRNSTLLATNNIPPMDPLAHDHYYGDVADDARFTNPDAGYLVPSHHKDSKPRSAKEGGSPADSLFDPETDESKWIHRDKLVQIENEELQAAGFVLAPAKDNRTRSKSGNRLKRDQSQDKLSGQARSIGGGEHIGSRSRKNSSATQDWDKRADDGAEHADSSYSTSNPGAKVTSRIPVPRTKAYPTTPTDEKVAAFARKRDSSPEEDKEKIAIPKTRGRSGSTGNALAKAANGPDARPVAKRADTSPIKSKPAAGAKKVSGKAATTTTARPRTRGASNKDSTGARPTTRSGDRELSPTTHKSMEGEPPWMVSAFRPDPRLPPEEQLLPTVAKRLQQEKWEREGKVGTVYDKEFRPLTDEGFLEPPEHPIVAPEHEPVEDKTENANENEKEQEKENEKEQQQADWPLKPAEPQCPQSPPPPSLHSLQSPRSPAPVGRTNSYSTMPKIADKPALTTVPSPKNPPQPPQPPHPSQVIRLPEPPEDPPTKKEKGGCGLCIVM